MTCVHLGHLALVRSVNGEATLVPKVVDAFKTYPKGSPVPKEVSGPGRIFITPAEWIASPHENDMAAGVSFTAEIHTVDGDDMALARELFVEMVHELERERWAALGSRLDVKVTRL